MLGMSRILGPETAARQVSPAQASIIQAAVKKHLLVDRTLTEFLSDHRNLRRELRLVRSADDVAPIQPIEKKLFAHQRVALSFMKLLDAYLLADQPGVGKTPVAIVWTSRKLLALEPGHRRVLVITPNSAKDQWRRELKRWRLDKLKITIVDGTKIEQTRLLARSLGWVIAHPEALVHAKKGALAQPWDAVIFDEAQAIRNRKAKRSETAFELQSTYRLALTGHPFFNSPDELFAILKFLYPTEYTSFWRFWGMHVNAIPKAFGGFQINGVRDPKLLRWEIAPFSLRRTKRRVFKHLPPIIRLARRANLTTKGEREYQRLKKEFFVELEAHHGKKRILAIPSVLARVTRLRQYLIDPGLLGAKEPSVKYTIVKEIMSELDGPPVIFTMFRQAALRLQVFLAGVTGLIVGGMTRANRRRVEQLFHQGKLDALIVVTQAGGTALNLGRYGYVIMLDLPWSAAELEQAEGRVDRPIEGTGEVVPTTSFRVIVKGTYEERQERRLEDKHAMFKEVFTVPEIRRLFA